MSTLNYLVRFVIVGCILIMSDAQYLNNDRIARSCVGPRCGLRNGAIGIGAGIAGTAGTPAVADATIAGAAGTAAAVPVVGAAPTAAAGAAAVAPTVGTVPATAIGTAGVAPATGTAAAAPAVETVGGATSTTGTGRGFSKVW